MKTAIKVRSQIETGWSNELAELLNSLARLESSMGNYSRIVVSFKFGGWLSSTSEIYLEKLVVEDLQIFNACFFPGRVTRSNRGNLRSQYFNDSFYFAPIEQLETWLQSVTSTLQSEMKDRTPIKLHVRCKNEHWRTVLALGFLAYENQLRLRSSYGCWSELLWGEG